MVRIVVDPITRIEGHLRIEADIKDGKIERGYSSGTMIRGMEKILLGRDPRDAWAFAQRICGVCTTMHALVSVRAVEDALDIRIPTNANHIRNIMENVIFIHDHVVHFYHLHAMDWVDIVSALKADPAETSKIAQSISSWPKSSAGYFKDQQDKLRKFVESGQLGIFANAYWGHPSYKLPPEVNLLAYVHYLEALEFQKELVKIHTIFGGKNPHPNYVVGGMACSIDPNSDTAINMERLNYVKRIIDMTIEFVEQVYVPDILAIGSYYKDWLYGGGLKNFLTYGGLPTTDIRDPQSYKFPRGVILNGNLNEVLPVDLLKKEEIVEYVDSSWYTHSNDGGLHPFDGETQFNFTGPKAPFTHLNVDEKYSWIKTPRWHNKPVEVGPLARMLVGYASGNTEIRDITNDALGRLDLGMDAMYSALGRTLARALETKLTAHWLLESFNSLVANVKAGNLATFNDTKWEPKSWPKEAKGVGTSEAPRGALGHWIRIKDEKIANYQCVVPTTWNASPIDRFGQIGAFESSLAGTPVFDQDQPLEIIRVIHSFDPCLACAVHMVDLEKNKKTSFQIE